ncbi:hypothetical protein GGQ04_002912 [Salinibacter ruber]|uniref:hypothetical protein n=1 Tax=Salinibacter ruber TaxID=146919 RepID=UPI00216A0572|nr:hypothetical protein [Salinibacter ruber]MCS4047763.1 hypothetical protein [Salinibacter ruber]
MLHSRKERLNYPITVFESEPNREGQLAVTRVAEEKEVEEGVFIWNRTSRTTRSDKDDWTGQKVEVYSENFSVNDRGGVPSGVEECLKGRRNSISHPDGCDIEWDDGEVLVTAKYREEFARFASAVDQMDEVEPHDIKSPYPFTEEQPMRICVSGVWKEWMGIEEALELTSIE